VDARKSVFLQGIMDDLDKYGQDGWELVSVTGWLYYFKRPVEKVSRQAGFTSNEL
jgi:hypothetical protein